MKAEERAAIDQALELAAAGFGAFSLKRNSKEPLTPRGFHDASTDPDAITKMLSAPGCRGQYGIVPPAGIGLADADEGAELLEWPQTRETITRKGLHVFLGVGAYDGSSIVRDGHKIILRTAGKGYCVGPGSRIDGFTYTSNGIAEIAQAPFEWLHPPKQQPAGGFRSAGDGAIGEGGRHAFIRDKAWELRKMGLHGAELWKAIYAINEIRCKPPLPPERLKRAIGDVDQAGTEAGTAPAQELRMRSMKDESMAEAEWLWPDWLPARSLALLAGYEGVGKSTIAADLAARVTTGQLGAAGRVGLVGTEDDVATRLLPRLSAAGADLGRIDLWETPEGRAPSLGDLGTIRAAIAKQKPALIIVDPITTRLQSDNTNSETDVRQVLDELAAIVAELDTVLLGIIHLNKKDGLPILDRLLGSRGFSAVVRAVLFSGKLDDGDMALGIAKSNYAATDRLMRYSIVPATVTDGAVTTTSSRIEWDEVERSRIEDKLAQGRKSKQKQTGKDWLQAFMQEHGGSCPVATAIEAGEEAGYSKRSVQRYASQLGYKSKPSGFGGSRIYTRDGFTGQL